MAGQLVRLSDYSVGSDRTAESNIDTPHRSAKLRMGVSGASDHQFGGGDPVSIDELYKVKEAITPELRSALELLATCKHRIREASEALNEGNRIASDDAMQRFFVLLPELFCCRGLGDGFGAIINAVFQGLRNLEGIAPNKDQIEEIGQVIEFLRSQPFIPFETAVEQIGKLEERELSVEPPGFDALTDLLSE